MEKIAVVTGGTRGIGRAITLKLARASYTVFALYATNRKAASDLEDTAAAENLKVTCLRGDLTREETFEHSLQAVLAAAPNIHCFVHSAASRAA